MTAPLRAPHHSSNMAQPQQAQGGVELALLAALQAAPAQQQHPQQQQPAPPHAPASGSYRQRAPTSFRGVTRTSGTNSGLHKFDVQ